jgi:cytochrome c-type biogenesis protein
MSLRHASNPASRSTSRAPLIVGGVLALLLVAALLNRLVAGPADPASSANVLVLAIPAFLAGLLSFLSPCTLPILPSYFAFTFGARREQIVGMTIAFFFGLATTMVALGATASALSRLLFQNLSQITLVGGLIVIAFGVMSLLGKGFTGMQIAERPNASLAGSYVFGATFALGWTACVGPILGALLTMLAAQGVAVLQGAALSFIYALGLGAPLILTASLFSRLGPESRVWRLMRGRGFTVSLGGTTLHLHTTSVASGLLLIAVGVLLATGQLTIFSQWAAQTPLTDRLLDLEDSMRRTLLGN